MTSISLHCFLDGLDGRCQDSFQTLLVHGHLNCDVRKGAVYGVISARADGRIKLGVGMILGNGTDDHGEVLHDLEGEEEGYTPEGRGGRGKSKADVAAVEQKLFDQGTNTVTYKN